jgi:dipeptidyl aminopeptidase/acylaminoacyl peptidase
MRVRAYRAIESGRPSFWGIQRMQSARAIVRFSIALACAGALTAPAAAAPRHVMAEDLFKISFVASDQISHDGSRVAFVVTKLDGPKNTYLSNIWIADVASGKVWQLTRGDSDADPSWSPDDKWIAFDSGRGDKQQLYKIALDGGEAQRLTNAMGGAFGPQWSHSGSRILFQSITVAPKPKADVDWQAAGFTPSSDQATSDVRTIDVLHFEDNGQGETWSKTTHLWTVNADGTNARALTSGTMYSEGQAAWSPDDKQIAFVTYRGFDPTLFRSDIYVIPSGGGDMRKLPFPPGSLNGPTWSHDGASLWYFASKSSDPAGYPSVMSSTLDGSSSHLLVPANTFAFGDAILTDTKEGGAGCGPLFGPGDRWFIANVSTPGAAVLMRFDTQTGQSQTVIGNDTEVSECSMSDDGSRVAYVSSDATHPGEVFIADASGDGQRQLTQMNRDYLASVALSDPEPISVRNSAGETVPAWIVRPPNAVPGRRYPTILNIHGGPETEFGNSFFHEFQYLAGLGYNVVYADPRGSVGFGYKYEAELNGNWGDPMFQDEMAVMDAALRRPDVDASRLCVSGGSYGGYSTLWIIGHTHRFKCAVAERVASNLETLILASDFASGQSSEHSWGNPWEHPAVYWKQSPIAYVANVTTPLMLIHGDQDIRTPIDQTLQEYSALKILGRPVKYVAFPRENHDLSRTGEPIHRVERLRMMAKWFAQYVGP